MKKENQLHKGFSSEGEDRYDNGYQEQVPMDYFLAEELEEFAQEQTSSKQKDCTILWWNGNYQKPNIRISDGKFVYKSKHRNVTKIQLRSVPGGGIRYYSSLGTYRIPNGDYILSLWGSTYGYNKISACVEYKI